MAVMKNNVRKILAVTLMLSMMFSMVTCVWAEDKTEIIGVEMVDAVAEKIVTENSFSEATEEQVFEDIEILEQIGISVKDIEGASEEKNQLVYSMPVKDDVTDEIVVKKNDVGDITMWVDEGEIHNELILKADGKVILDENEVIYETEEIQSVDENVVSDEVEVYPSTGGIKWYKASAAPSKLRSASYKSYSENWRCSSVNLQKALGNIAYSTLVGLATGGASGGAVGFTTSAFYELVSYDKNSKCISYIDYIAKGKNNARYFKGRRYTYAAKGFKGKKTTTYSYGIMQ